MKRILLIGLIFGLALAAYGYWGALRDPIVRAATIKLTDWPQGQAPLRIALLSDLMSRVPTCGPNGSRGSSPR